MKRVTAACLYQTLHFQLKEDIPHDDAVRMVNAEIENYKAGLVRKNIKHKIDSLQVQPDGSIILKIRKQNLHTSVGTYLD